MAENSEKAHFLVGLMRGTCDDGGESPYMYVAIFVDHLEAFRDALDSGEDIDINRYGVVLESGVGEPSDEVKRRMTELYAFDHENQLFL